MVEKLNDSDFNTFRITELLELRLENGRTNIYVDNKRFLQCKFLLIILPQSNKKVMERQETIDSIDEASLELPNMSKHLEGRQQDRSMGIDAKTEFWGHCSNLEAWVENNYDTRIIHSRLAFPLLKKLADCGDPIASKQFEIEIRKRFFSGYLPTMIYLMENGYLNYFDKEGRLECMEAFREAKKQEDKGLIAKSLKSFDGWNLQDELDILKKFELEDDEDEWEEIDDDDFW